MHISSTISTRNPIARLALSALLPLTFAACGGGPLQPTSVGGPAGVNLSGTVLGTAHSSSAGVTAFASTADAITVTVVEMPGAEAQVGADGTFTLRGLPEGGFTLVFTGAAGEPLGQLSFSGVKPNQEITITVTVNGGSVTLVEEQRNGIGNGDLEIEGRIDAVVSVDLAGDSLFTIGGYPVVARPGQTTIRKGNRALTVEELKVGDRVHVKAVYLEPAPGTDPADQQVLAYEIKLQDEAADENDDDDSDAGNEKVTICHKKKNTLSISINAWPAHQAHGDTMGACQG